MTVESKIVYRSDASEVKRDIATLKAARAELEKMRAGTAADPKIALESLKGQNKLSAIRAQSEAKSDAISKKGIVDLNSFKEKRAIVSAEKSAKGEGAIEKAKAKAKEKADADFSKASTKVRANLQKEHERIAAKDAKAMTDKLKFETPKEGGGLGISITDMKSALDMALQVGKVIYSAGAAVVQAQAFREDITRGLETVLKSKSAAQQALDKAAETADFLGQSRAAVSGQALALMAKGFDQAKADEITRRFADLTTVTPDANLAGLTKALTDIKGKGKLAGQEVLQFANAGLSANAVYDALSEQLGKSRADIQKMQEAGEITADMATEGILAAIGKMAGGKGAGEAARAKAREDLSGLINQIGNIPSDLLFDVKVGPGMDKLKGAMREVLDFFAAGSVTGKDVRQVLGDTINAFAEGLFGIDTSKGITETLKGLLETLRASKGDIKGFAAGIASIGSTLAGITGFFGKISQLRTEFERISGINISGPLGIFKGLLLGIPSIILQTLSGAIQSITGFSLWDAGANLVNSLAGGIKSTAQSVIDAVTSTVGGAISWAKKLLGIASPSKVFMQIGDFSGKGLAMGLSANDNAVKRAAGGMAGASVAGASTAGLGSRSSRVSTTTIAATFAPNYHVTALGPKEVDELKALQADERAKFDMMIASYMTREANAA